MSKRKQHWLDGFCLSGLQRFRLAHSPEGHEELISMICQMSAPVHVGFEETGGQEWVLWTALMEVGIEAQQLPLAQINAFAMSRGTRAKTDRIDAKLIARFMMPGLRRGGRYRVRTCAFSEP